MISNFYDECLCEWYTTKFIENRRIFESSLYANQITTRMHCQLNVNLFVFIIIHR